MEETTITKVDVRIERETREGERKKTKKERGGRVESGAVGGIGSNTGVRDRERRVWTKKTKGIELGRYSACRKRKKGEKPSWVKEGAFAW